MGRPLKHIMGCCSVVWLGSSRNIFLFFVSIMLLVSGLACSNANASKSNVLSYLMSASGQDLRGLPNCDFFLPEGEHPNEPWRLGDDIAYYMAEMNEGENAILVECEKTSNDKKRCTVSFNHNVGELVWSRYYRFDFNPIGGGLAGSALINSLECFTVP